MQMNNSEIVMRYNQAKNKGEQVKILAELNACPAERIIGILVSAGIDNRCFNQLRAKLNQDKSENNPSSHYKVDSSGDIIKVIDDQPEIIPEPPVQKPITVDDAVAAIRAELDEINRQQYELDMRKADLYKQIWDMLGEM